METRKQYLPYLGMAMVAVSAWMTWSNLSNSGDEEERPEERPRRTTIRPSERKSERLNGTLERIFNSERPERDPDLAEMIRKQVKRDAAAIADLALRIDRPESKEAIIRAVMQAWARTDPEAALCWAAELDDPQAAQASMVHVCVEVSETDPELAIMWVGEHRLDRKVDGLAGNLVTQWAGQNLSAARDWVRRQPAGDQRDELMSRIAFVHSKADPAAAAQLVADEVSPGTRQTEAAISVVHQWGLQDLQAATEWVSLFPEGSLRERALRELEGINLYRQGQISR